MADTNSVSVKNKLNMQRAAVLLDLWSSSDEEDVNNGILSRDLAPNTQSSERLSQTKPSSSCQQRIKPSFNTKERVAHLPSREQERLRREKAKCQSKNPLPLPHSRPSAINKQPGNQHRSAKLTTASQSADPTVVSSNRCKAASPVFGFFRKTHIQTPSSDSSNSSTEEDDAEPCPGGTTAFSKNDSQSRANTGWQSSREQSKKTHSRGIMSSSSSGSLPNAESGAKGVKSGYTYSRANIGWQPRSKQTNNTSNNVMIDVDSSSSSSSSSSDSESLLSPSKSKQAQTRQFSKTTTLSKQKGSNDTSKTFSSRYKNVSEPGQMGRYKRELSRITGPAPRYKRARLSPTFDSETSNSSSSSSDEETSLGPGFSSLKSRKRSPQASNRNRDCIETAANATNNASPKKVAKQTIINLFGRTTSDDDGDLTEEDVQEVKDGQEDISTQKMSNSASRTSNASTLSIPADLDYNLYQTDVDPWSKNQAIFYRQDASATTTMKKPSSEKDDSVILVDITQSAERGAMAGQSSPKINLTSLTGQSKDNKSTDSLSTIFPRKLQSYKEQSEDDEITESLSPIIPQKLQPYKELAIKPSDVRSNTESIIVGNVDASRTFKNTQVDSPGTSTGSKLIFRPWQKDSVFTSVDSSERNGSNKQPQNSKEKNGSEDHSKSQSSVFDAHSGRVGRHAKRIATVDKSREVSEIIAPNPRRNTTISNSPLDEFHFPTMSFEENHLQWLRASQGLVYNETATKSQLVGNPVMIYQKNFFVNSQSRGESSQSSAALEMADFSFEENHHRWQEQRRGLVDNQAYPKSPIFERSKQMRGLVDDEARPESPVFQKSLRIPSRKILATRESRRKPTQSSDSRNAADLSWEEDRLDERSEQKREDGEAAVNSSSLRVERRGGTKKHEHRGIGVKQSQQPKSTPDVVGASSHVTDQSVGHFTHQGDKRQKNRGSRQHIKDDDSHLVTVRPGQYGVQHSQPDLEEVGRHVTRQQMPIANDKTRSIIKRRSSDHEVQVVESQGSKNSSVQLPLKARRKSKHDVDHTGNHPSRWNRDSYNSDSQAIGRNAGISQEDVQIIESQDSSLNSPGGSSGRTNRRGEEFASVSPAAIDIEIAQLIRQMDEDERMAKQLQERFDAELARLTQAHNEIMADVTELSEDIPIPQMPQFHRRPIFNLRALTSAPTGREMVWRDDLVDMNPVNAAMMAEMGHVEVQTGHGHHGRQRRGRARGRGRSRVRGQHRNHMPLPVADGSDYEALWNLSERVGEAVSKGLPQSSINLLPTFLYTSGKDIDETECSICMGDYEVGENMRRLPCFHFYHAACIDKWLKDNRICPVCREEVNFDPVNFT